MLMCKGQAAARGHVDLSVLCCHFGAWGSWCHKGLGCSLGLCLDLWKWRNQYLSWCTWFFYYWGLVSHWSHSDIQAKASAKNRAWVHIPAAAGIFVGVHSLWTSKPIPLHRPWPLTTTLSWLTPTCLVGILWVFSCGKLFLSPNTGSHTPLLHYGKVCC